MKEDKKTWRIKYITNGQEQSITVKYSSKMEACDVELAYTESVGNMGQYSFRIIEVKEV